MDDTQLDQADLVAINLAIACEIPSLRHLDISSYIHIVDAWTEQFRRELPAIEQGFQRHAERFRNDIWFFRVGMLSLFMGTDLGMRYKQDQKRLTEISYTNPSDLF